MIGWLRRRRRPHIVDVGESGSTIFGAGQMTLGHEATLEWPPWSTSSGSGEIFLAAFERVAERMRDVPDVYVPPSPWGTYSGGNPWAAYTRRGNR